MEWAVEGRSLNPNQRMFILERDGFTCRKCGKMPEIKTMSGYYRRWLQDEGLEYGMEAYYRVRRQILLESNFTRIVKEIIPKCGNSWDVILEYFTDYGFEVDHIIPIRDGGTNLPSNLQTLCRGCHKRKTRDDRIAREFIRFERAPVGILL